MNAFQEQIAKNNRRGELVAILVLSLVGFLVAAGSVIGFQLAGRHLQFLIPVVMGLTVGVVGLVKLARRRREKL
jgi:hypothetical protein